MQTTIVIFLWIVGALCLVVIADLTYEIIVRAQDRKAGQQAMKQDKPAEITNTTTTTEIATTTTATTDSEESEDIPEVTTRRKKPNKKTERWMRYKPRRKN